MLNSKNKKTMRKEEIIAARNMSVSDMIEAGLSIEELLEVGVVDMEYYPPSESMEYFDGQYYYNKSGQQLRDLSQYDTMSEGYTPFGDE
jgi:hypothetical protein